MIHVAHAGALSADERRMLGDLLGRLGEIKFDENPDHLPKFYYAGGPGAEAPLAWLVITFAGMGLAILAKSFLEEIGSSLGKKVVEYFERKKSPCHRFPMDIYDPVHAIAVVFQPKPELIAVVPLRSGPPEGQLNFDEQIAAIEELAACMPTQKPAVIEAWYSSSANRWEARISREGAHEPILFDPERGVFYIAQ